LGNYKAYWGKAAMTQNAIESIEIYPNIVVYKNAFSNISDTYNALKNSTGEEEDLFSPWTQWSHFGEYLNPPFKGLPHRLDIDSVESINPKTEKQESQKNAILELLKGFYAVTEDYISRNNLDIDKNKKVLTKDGLETDEWIINGPSIARYRTDIEDEIAMTYHSDFIREPIVSPGYKFAVTALAYFNDDYDGGEIDFIVSGEAFMYKPEAGDFLVFPSGNPNILTKDGSVYIHGVMPARGANKYLSRMYWMKYDVGADEWFEKEKEFGKEVWESMQPDIMQKFRDDNPNRFSAKNERRIR
jgi:hypothetical protein